ncbi:hypothetical protein ABT040_18390 [Streptomyces sp. NPDC002688]|uniref:hypothetical protein n=1 Tax=Streptomyces sp. NPDC002688 TaxID=3154423 RepID=UPI0033167926
MDDKDEREHVSAEDAFAEQLDRALRMSRRIRNPEPYVIDDPSPATRPLTDTQKKVATGLRWVDEYLAEQRRKRDRERAQLRSLLDTHEDWIVEEIDHRKKERERKAHKEAQQTSHVEPPQWEPPPLLAPPTGWREPTNPPWYRADLDDLQRRLDRANHPSQHRTGGGWD